MRYFFSDERVAAYMVKDHDFSIIVRDPEGNEITHNKEKEEDDRYTLGYCLGEHLYDPHQKKFYIHPVSLPLLEGMSEEKKAAMKLLGLWPESQEQ